MDLLVVTDAGERVALFGLLNKIEVGTMRSAMMNGAAQPFPERKVKSDLTEVATTIYEQMKLTPDYRLRIRTGETPVAWFLSAVHRIMAPRSTSFAPYPQDDPDNGPLEEWAAMTPWFRDIKPDDDEAWAECNLPDLRNCDTLPLAYWEGLFYALIAEIQYLYQDLRQRYGVRFELGKQILHSQGRDKCSRHPFTVVEFARLLETCWIKVTSTHLTAALDYAIMQRAAFLANGEPPTLDNMMKYQGLCDVNTMEPIFIIRWLSEKLATEIKVAVRSNIQQVPGLLDAYDAVRVRRNEIKAQRQQTQEALFGARCEPEEEEKRNETPVPPRRPLPGVAQTPVDSYSQRSATEVPNFQRRGVVRKPSNLACFNQESFASTNLYHDQSTQRQPQGVTSPHTEKACTSPAIFEPLCHASSTPAPEPAPLISPYDKGFFMEQSHSSGRIEKTSTIPSAQYQTSPETQPTSFVHESFDSMGHNKKFKLSANTSSFPAFDDTRPLPLLPYEEEYGSGEQTEEDDYPALRAPIRPRPSTSPTAPPPNVVVASRSRTLPTSPAPFGSHEELEPLSRQKKVDHRYVSAGGQTPLHERDVMEDFRLPVNESEKQATFNMKKEDFYNQLEDIPRAEGSRKASVANSSEKREKTRFRIFSRKSSKNDYDP